MAKLNLSNKVLSLENGVFKITEQEIVIFQTNTAFDENSQLSEIFDSKEEFLRDHVFSSPDEYDLSQEDMEKAIEFILQN